MANGSTISFGDITMIPNFNQLQVSNNLNSIPTAQSHLHRLWPSTIDMPEDIHMTSPMTPPPTVPMPSAPLEHEPWSGEYKEFNPFAISNGRPALTDLESQLPETVTESFANAYPPACVSASPSLSWEPSTRSGSTQEEEDEFIRRIQIKVGGTTKLSLCHDSSQVRRVVIQALADLQSSASESTRVRKGQLFACERRIVRTVTNRGAALRSRMRQRNEMEKIKSELREKERRVRELEQTIQSLCEAYSVPLPPLYHEPKSINHDLGHPGESACGLDLEHEDKHCARNCQR